MTRRNSIVLATAGLILLGSLVWPAYAQNKQDRQRRGDHSGNVGEIIAAMDAQKMTLAGAVAAAEKAKSGRAIGVRAETEGNKVGFRVEMGVNGQMVTVTVDSDGSVRDMSPRGRGSRDNNGDRSERRQKKGDRNPDSPNPTPTTPTQPKP